MPAQAALYLPYPDIDLASVVPGARFVPADDGGRFAATVGDELVEFSSIAPAALPRHLDGLRGWLAQCTGSPERRHDAWEALRHTRTVLGLVARSEFVDNHRLWQVLFEIADAFDGFVFVNDSVLLPSGTVLCGAMLDA